MMVQVMGRFSRMHPVQRIKHVVDIQTAVPVNVIVTNNLVRAKDAPVIGQTDEVVTGSKVGSIFLTVEVVATEAATGKTPNFYLQVHKNPGGNLTFPDGNKVGINDNKRFVIHQEMVMLQGENQVGNPRNVFKGVIRIPSGYQRMGPNDTLVLQLWIPSTGVAVNACAQCHYKEFR